MDTRKIEQLLEKIANRLDDIHDELQWYKNGTFGQTISKGFTDIENSLSSLETSLSNDLSAIQSAVEALDK